MRVNRTTNDFYLKESENFSRRHSYPAFQPRAMAIYPGSVTNSAYGSSGPGEVILVETSQGQKFLAAVVCGGITGTENLLFREAVGFHWQVRRLTPGKPADVIIVPRAVQQMRDMILDLPRRKSGTTRIPVCRLQEIFEPIGFGVSTRIEQGKPLPAREAHVGFQLLDAQIGMGRIFTKSSAAVSFKPLSTRMTLKL